MSQSAKKSKSLFNSFTRLHRLATLGGAAIAAWFSSQFLQQSSTTESSIPSQDSQETMIRAVPEASEEMQIAAQATSEPQLNILVSLVVVLSVIVTGLVIELIIRQRKKQIIN